MIFDTILSGITNALLALFSLLPDKNPIPSGFEEALAWLTEMVSSIIYALNGADGVGTNLALILGLYTAFTIAMYVWSGVKMIANLIRGSGA